MSTWHYQVMKHSDGTLAIHEYYVMSDADGWTQEPTKISGDSIEDIKKMLNMVLDDIERHGVKDYEVQE